MQLPISHMQQRWPISHHFRDTASFRLKTHIFPIPLHSTPNLKTFPVHCIAKFRRKLWLRAHYLCKKFSPKTYYLATVNLLQKDDRQTTS